VSDVRHIFWNRHPGLVWSNPQAGDDVRIRAALLCPRFSQIVAIVAEFGLQRVAAEWRVLEEEGTAAAHRAAPVVGRILRSIRLGAGDAAARD